MVKTPRKRRSAVSDNTVYLGRHKNSASTALVPVSDASKAIRRRGPKAVVLTKTLEADLGHALSLSGQADAPNTRRAYEFDLQDWKLYADANGLEGFPIEPRALLAYIGNMQRRGLRYTTIRRRCSALSRAHKRDGIANPLEDPKVRDLLKSIARTLGRAPKNRKSAITPTMVAYIIDSECSALIERAAVAVGYLTAMRRSELTSFLREDVEKHKLGVVIHLRRSKTDQEGQGMVKGLPFQPKGHRCAARLLLDWIEESDPAPGDRIFPIDGKQISDMCKRAAKAVGEDPKKFGAHSLRSGFVTTANEAGVAMATWMEVTGHKDTNTAAGYNRSASALANPAALAVAEALAAVPRPSMRGRNRSRAR